MNRPINNELKKNLQKLYKQGKITLDQFKTQVENTFINTRVDDTGNYYDSSAYGLMKATADPENLLGFIETEQKFEEQQLFRQKRKYDKELKEFVNGDGIPVSGLTNSAAMAINQKLRGQVSKILGHDNEEVNKFFRAKTYEDFDRLRKDKPKLNAQQKQNYVQLANKIDIARASGQLASTPGPWESIIDNIKNKKGLDSETKLKILSESQNIPDTRSSVPVTPTTVNDDVSMEIPQLNAEQESAAAEEKSVEEIIKERADARLQKQIEDFENQKGITRLEKFRPV